MLAIRVSSSHLKFQILLKTTNLEEDYEKFGKIRCGSSTEEVNDVSPNQSPWRPSGISDWVEKH